MIEPLKQILPENKLNEFLSWGQEKDIKANEYFLSIEEIPLKIAFVMSGLFRYVYITEKGDEITKGLIAENNFLSSYSAMITSSPSYFAIEALEDSKIFEIPWDCYTKNMENDIFWIKFLLKFVEKGYMIKEKRERDLLLLDAEARYKNFLMEFPGMDQRLKQGVIASYLGIKPETLSRIRRK
jgi:CRP-like cAMP-binding protein